MPGREGARHFLWLHGISASAGAVGDVELELEAPGGKLQGVRCMHELLELFRKSGLLCRRASGVDGVEDADPHSRIERRESAL